MNKKFNNNAITVLGYTDASGNIEYNKGLSKKRADAVKSFIIATTGFNASKIKSIGMGINTSSPISSKDPGSRKVEIKIE